MPRALVGKARGISGPPLVPILDTRHVFHRILL